MLILAIPVILWIILRVSLPAGPYAMDQGGHKGSFFPLLACYSVLAYMVFFGSLLGAFFCYCENQNAPWSLFLASGVEALLFAGYLLFNYERYLHATASGASNYSINRYAATLALGVSAILTFVLAMGLTAVGVAT